MTMRNGANRDERSREAVRNARPLDEVLQRWGEGVFGARDVLLRAARRSAEDARAAKENLRTKKERSEGRGSVYASALELGADVAEEVRAQTFLGAWATLAAGERLSRPFGRPFPALPERVAPSPRTLALWAAAFDIYTGYAALRGRERLLSGLSNTADVETLHERGASRALDAARSLGGTLIKAGQFAATRPDLLPAPYIEALSTLHDRVPPRPLGVIRRAVESETGRPLARLFSRFDPEPVAAASIAQVHRARLLDGREVAVKVRYPEIADLIEADLDSLETVFDAVNRFEPDVDLRPITDYLRWTLPLELDLSREAGAMEDLRRTLSDREDVLIPSEIEGFTSEGLLVMEYVEGIKVTDREALVKNGIDPAALARLLNDVFADQLFRRGVLHADPHPGNLLVQPGKDDRNPRLVLLDHGLTLPVDRPFVDALAKMVAALREFDLDALNVALNEAGLPLNEDADLGALLRLVGVVMNPDGASDDPGETMDLGDFTGSLGAGVRNLPPRLLLVGRAIGLLDGVTRQLDEDLDSLEIVARYAGAE